MRAGQREERVQSGQIAAEARPRQHRADNDVPQRVSDEAVGAQKKKKKALMIERLQLRSV